MRVADQLQGVPCGIYEIISETGRKSYKIFVNDEAYADYLAEKARIIITRFIVAKIIKHSQKQKYEDYNSMKSNPIYLLAE